MPVNESDAPLLLTPEQAARYLSVGRTTIYDLIRSGDLASVKIGRLRRIPRVAIKQWLADQLALDVEWQRR
ncbi:MAG: helix-turn-helix domain-containing protein [Myxococcales bacterium]|nr:helix-turn-helix domain-containing protein [Myxococcales bacterium]